MRFHIFIFLSLLVLVPIITGCSDDETDTFEFSPMIHEFSTNKEKGLSIGVKKGDTFYISFSLTVNQTYYLVKSISVGDPTIDIVSSPSTTASSLTSFKTDQISYKAMYSGLHYLRLQDNGDTENGSHLCFHIAESESNLYDCRSSGDSGGSGRTFKVYSTNPEDNKTINLANTDSRFPVKIVFTLDVDIDSFTTNTANDNCSGTVMVSKNDFQTCVPMSKQPYFEMNDINSIIELLPESDWISGNTYKIRVMPNVKSAEGEELGTMWVSTDGFTVQ